LADVLGLCRAAKATLGGDQVEGPEMSVDAVCAEVLRLGSRHVVLTGGEPMIAREVHALAARLQAGGRHITIETAGTIAPEGIACDLASISPKLCNSTPADDDPRGRGWRDRHERMRRRPDIVGAWVEAARRTGSAYQLKFVVDREKDLDEVRAVIGQLQHVDAAKVMLMAQGVKQEELVRKAQWIVESCKQYGYSYTPRLHIQLFGNRRGT